MYLEFLYKNLPLNIFCQTEGSYADLIVTILSILLEVHIKPH